MFYLVAKVERNLLLLTGMSSTHRITYGVSDLPFLAYQGVGALLVMVLVGFWVGREHLIGVVGKALGRSPTVDDSDETMSYRAAVGGLVGGFGVMTVWLWLMGTKVWVALLFLVLALLIFVGITRIVCEAGLAAVRAPMTAPDLTMMGLGSQLVGNSGVLDLSLVGRHPRVHHGHVRQWPEADRGDGSAQPPCDRLPHRQDGQRHLCSWLGISQAIHRGFPQTLHVPDREDLARHRVPRRLPIIAGAVQEGGVIRAHDTGVADTA